MANIPITSERIVLRNICDDDIKDVYNLFSNKETMYFLDLPHPNLEYTKTYIEHLIKKYDENPRRCWKLAIISLKTQDFMGVVELNIETSYIEEGRADLSYYLLPNHWNKGYATEASKLIIKFGFEFLKLNKITAGCLQLNTASEKVMLRCNMLKEAEFKKHTKFNGHWINRVEYAILKDEYLVL